MKARWNSSPEHLAWHFVAAVLLMIPLIVMLPVAAPPGFASQSTGLGTTANLHGRVVSLEGQTPIAGARVQVPTLGLDTATDRAGRFSWDALPMTSPERRIRVVISAPGFANWTITDAPLRAADTLILNAELGTAPVHIQVPPPRRSQTGLGRDSRPEQRSQESTLNDLNRPLPDFIRVRVSKGNYHCDTKASYTVKVVPFMDYVRHVLPNEWRDDYAESTRAGAMAVKTYAWYWIKQGGKWPDADVWDSTCDQVYNPAFELASTNAAVYHTWNWRMTKYGSLFQASYRALESQCGSRINCIGQAEADQMAKNGSTWDEILVHFYEDSIFTTIMPPPAAGFNLRFFGNGSGVHDRLLIPIGGSPGPAVDVGAKDFTIEWWQRAYAFNNLAPAIPCAAENWIFGNTVIDRHREAGDRRFGVSLLGGLVAFGVAGQDQGPGPPTDTICSLSNVADGRWHHVAVQRRADGWMQIFVDGRLEAERQGPPGDISYPDGDPGQLPSDPYLVIGASKRDDNPLGIHPSFNGWLDEVRVSNSLRYGGNFTPLGSPFLPDSQTLALYALDDGFGNIVSDLSPGGLHPATRIYGGAINGPEWGFSTLYMDQFVYLVTVRH